MYELDNAEKRYSTLANHYGDKGRATQAVLRLEDDVEDAESKLKRRYILYSFRYHPRVDVGLALKIQINFSIAERRRAIRVKQWCLRGLFVSHEW
jgi:hypothetical protein